MALHLLRLSDFAKEDLREYIDRAIELKKEAAAGVKHQQLTGKTIGMVFEKASIRARPLCRNSLNAAC
jgi:ornithine carbamoyltransferase